MEYFGMNLYYTEPWAVSYGFAVTQVIVPESEQQTHTGLRGRTNPDTVRCTGKLPSQYMGKEGARNHGFHPANPFCQPDLYHDGANLHGGAAYS